MRLKKWRKTSLGDCYIVGATIKNTRATYYIMSTIPTKTNDATTYEVTDRLRLQRVFARMKQSCYSPSHVSYPSYGGRGIYIASEWLDTGNSEAFVTWALANSYQHGLHINRIDNDGPYSPANCEFVTRQQNMANCQDTFWIEYQGVRQPFVLVMRNMPADSLLVKPSTIRERIKKGVSLEEAISTPKMCTIGVRTSRYVPKKAFVYNGKLALLKVHAADAGFATDTTTRSALWARIHAGWDLDRVFSEPIANRS